MAKGEEAARRAIAHDETLPQAWARACCYIELGENEKPLEAVAPLGADSGMVRLMRLLAEGDRARPRRYVDGNARSASVSML